MIREQIETAKYIDSSPQSTFEIEIPQLNKNTNWPANNSCHVVGGGIYWFGIRTLCPFESLHGMHRRPEP